MGMRLVTIDTKMTYFYSFVAFLFFCHFVTFWFMPEWPNGVMCPWSISFISSSSSFFFVSSFVSFLRTVKPATCVSELAEFYRDSCAHHNAEPIESIMKHLDTLDLSSHTRRPILNLREQNLTAESCEALEEVLKRVSTIYLRVLIHSNDFAECRRSTQSARDDRTEIIEMHSFSLSTNLCVRESIRDVFFLLRKQRRLFICVCSRM